MNEGTANRVAVMALYDALERRDAVAVMSLIDSNMQVYQSTELPWGGVYTGAEESLVFFENVTANIDAVLQFDSVLESGDHVVVAGRAVGTAKATGKSFDVPLVHLWQMHKGKITMLAAFLDHTTILPVLSPDGYAKPANGQVKSKFAIQQWKF